MLLTIFDGFEAIHINMTTLLTIPTNIAAIRQRLFDLDEPIDLTVAEFELYLPYVDNVYTKRMTRTTRNGNSMFEYTYYDCILRRPTHATANIATDKHGAKRTRRLGPTCPVRIKAIRIQYSNGETTYQISRLGSGHTHDITELDLIRRNSALRGVAAIETSKGYAPATIVGAIRGIGKDGGRKILEDAGGRYLTRQDVKNAGHAWRKANPDVRIAKPNPQWQELVLEAIETLEKAGYEAISIDSLDQNGDLTMGLVFAHPVRLQVLIQRG